MEILSDLWLGCQGDAGDMSFIKSRGINCVVNVSRELEFNKNYPLSMEQYRVSIDDFANGNDNDPESRIYSNDSENNYSEYNKAMYKQLDDVVYYIHNKLCQNKIILVFSKTGHIRGATIIIAYLVRYGKVSVKQGLEYLRTKVPSVYMREMNFIMALERYEK